MRTRNPYKIVSSGDPSAKRIVDANGTIVAFIYAMANKSWGLFDTDDKRITATQYPSPAKACAAYRSLAEPSVGEN